MKTNFRRKTNKNSVFRVHLIKVHSLTLRMYVQKWLQNQYLLTVIFHIPVCPGFTESSTGCTD